MAKANSGRGCRNQPPHELSAAIRSRTFGRRNRDRAKGPRRNRAIQSGPAPAALSVDDLVELGEAPNVWKHDKELNVLTYTPERWGAPYEIDLDDERLRTPAGELGWIRHIAEKNWAASPCVLADLVKAFEKLLDNPRY